MSCLGFIQVADRRAQNLIIHSLKETFPHVFVVGEEPENEELKADFDESLKHVPNLEHPQVVGQTFPSDMVYPAEVT